MLVIRQRNAITTNKFLLGIAVFVFGFITSYAALSVLPADNSPGRVAGISDNHQAPVSQTTSKNNSATKAINQSDESPDSSVEHVSASPVGESQPTPSQDSLPAKSAEGYTTHAGTYRDSVANSGVAPSVDEPTSTADSSPTIESENDKSSLLSPILDTLTDPLCSILCH